MFVRHCSARLPPRNSLPEIMTTLCLCCVSTFANDQQSGALQSQDCFNGKHDMHLRVQPSPPSLFSIFWALSPGIAGIKECYLALLESTYDTCREALMKLKVIKQGSKANKNASKHEIPTHAVFVSQISEGTKNAQHEGATQDRNFAPKYFLWRLL